MVFYNGSRNPLFIGLLQGINQYMDNQSHIMPWTNHHVKNGPNNLHVPSKKGNTQIIETIYVPPYVRNQGTEGGRKFVLGIAYTYLELDQEHTRTMFSPHQPQNVVA